MIDTLVSYVISNYLLIIYTKTTNYLKQEQSSLFGWRLLVIISLIMLGWHSIILIKINLGGLFYSFFFFFFFFFFFVFFLG